MPICKNCNNKFPCRLIIDGKLRNLAVRKFCTNCSPFNAHNTKQSLTNVNTESICDDCRRSFVYDRSKGSSLHCCNGCRVKRRNVKVKLKAVSYKGGKCSKCGYSKSVKALDFHHIDPTNKLFSISQGYNRAWEKLKLELDKCELLCSNCHREEHSG